MLKAKEAIPSLVERLDFSNGAIGLSFIWYPASLSIMAIGPDSIPALVSVFEKPGKGFNRYLAIHLLAKMESDDGRAALRKILKMETDRELRTEIVRLLKQKA